jgi:hypothetical protein
MQIMITKNMSEDESHSNSGEDNLMDLARENSTSGVMECLLAGRALHRNRVTVKEELIRSDVLNKEFTDKIKWLQDGYEDQSGDNNQIRNFIESIRDIQRKSFKNIVVKNGKATEEDDEYLRQWENDMNAAVESYRRKKAIHGCFFSACDFETRGGHHGRLWGRRMEFGYE